MTRDLLADLFTDLHAVTAGAVDDPQEPTAHDQRQEAARQYCLDMALTPEDDAGAYDWPQNLTDDQEVTERRHRAAGRVW